MPDKPSLFRFFRQEVHHEQIGLSVIPFAAWTARHGGNSANYTPFSNAPRASRPAKSHAAALHSISPRRPRATAEGSGRPCAHGANHSIRRRERPQRHAAQRRDCETEADRKAIQTLANGTEP